MVDITREEGTSVDGLKLPVWEGPDYLGQTSSWKVQPKHLRKVTYIYVHTNIHKV